MTLELLLARRDFTPERTIGQLYVTPECWTLEDAVRNGAKITGETAIPPGRYQIAITKSARFGRMLPILLDVPGFDGIRIHSGNTAADTEGCILVGNEREGNAILQSRLAMEKLQPKIADVLARGQECWITII